MPVTGVGVLAEACILGREFTHEKGTFVREWGKNVERQVVMRNKKGRTARNRNFFMTVCILALGVFSERRPFGCIIIWRRHKDFLAVWR